MPFGKFLIVLGVALTVAGVLLAAPPKIPWLGRLPGDIWIQRERFTLFFPLATCLLLSLLLTLLLNLFGHR